MARKYSIIIPVYNGEDRLESCLNSIKNQSYTNFEVIMVNDFSTDNSAQICKRWVKKDARFAFYESRGFGVSAARNTGLKNTTGDVITFCDDDDELLPDALELVEQLYDKFDIQKQIPPIVVTGLQKCNPNGEVVKELRHVHERYLSGEQLLAAMFCDSKVMGSVCNKFFLREFVQKIVFDTEIAYCEDMLFVVDCIVHNLDVCGYLSSAVTYQYFFSPQSATNRVERLFDENGQLKYMIAFDKMELLLQGVSSDVYSSKTLRKLQGLLCKKRYLIAAGLYCDFDLNEQQIKEVLQIMKENRTSFIRYLFHKEPLRTTYLLLRLIKKRLWR